MSLFQHNSIFYFFALWSVLCFGLCYSLSEEARLKSFVYLHEIDPTILVSLRYYNDENFVGRAITGYNEQVVIVTRKTAEALKEVQEELRNDGYSLVIYDGYRPVKAVQHFVQWSQDSEDQCKKLSYYPRVDKNLAFDLGYIAQRSGHSRGSTVDCTIIRIGFSVQAIVEKQRTLLDGFTIMFLDDGTVDMGSSFDLFDVASHTYTDLIEENYKKMRIYLKTVMEKHGFKNYAEEWWHFTLNNEPFPADQDTSYFDFEVE